jgi:hypothetical protein
MLRPPRASSEHRKTRQGKQTASLDHRETIKPRVVYVASANPLAGPPVRPTRPRHIWPRRRPTLPDGGGIGEPRLCARTHRLARRPGGQDVLPSRRTVRLPEGDVPAPAGAGVSKSTASRTSWRCRLRAVLKECPVSLRRGVSVGRRIATSTWRSELFVAIHIRERAAPAGITASHSVR